VITIYLKEVAPNHAQPQLAAFHVGPLLDHFGDDTCWDVSESRCRSYVAARTAGLAKRKPVKEATARRELVTLGAALSYAYRSRRITKPVFVWKPEQGQSRERWLTRSEVARLLFGALGFKAVAFDAAGAPTKWERKSKPQYHVARFILTALYTGTRHHSVLNLRWGVNSAAGWIDLENRVLYRRGQGERETNKRRTPAPINSRLLPHLRRWRRMTVAGPCEYDGEIIAKQKTGFARARANAGLGKDVTPHVLKHTCCTWLLQSGVSTYEVARYVGTTEAIITRVYGHHSPEHLSGARDAFHGRNVGRGKKAG
jgi:integrase